jgi:hypothetical protein
MFKHVSNPFEQTGIGTYIGYLKPDHPTVFTVISKDVTLSILKSHTLWQVIRNIYIYIWEKSVEWGLAS